MNFRNFNWQIWVGLLLTFVAGISYPVAFVWFPLTRDFPWANLLLYAIAAVFVIIGVRRAYSKDRRHPKRSKIGGTIIAFLCAAMFGLFIFGIFIGSRWLPASSGHPQVGQKAPDFTLLDTNSTSTSLTSLLTTPIAGKAPKGVLLIFYRGYW
jgi:hypothetical protein